MHIVLCWRCLKILILFYLTNNHLFTRQSDKLQEYKHPLSFRDSFSKLFFEQTTLGAESFSNKIIPSNQNFMPHLFAQLQAWSKN